MVQRATLVFITGIQWVCMPRGWSGRSRGGIWEFRRSWWHQPRAWYLRSQGSPHLLQVTSVRSEKSWHDCVYCPKQPFSSIQMTLLPWEQEVSRSCQLLLCKVLLDSSSEATFRKQFWGLISGLCSSHEALGFIVTFSFKHQELYIHIPISYHVPLPMVPFLFPKCPLLPSCHTYIVKSSLCIWDKAGNICLSLAYFNDNLQPRPFSCKWHNSALPHDWMSLHSVSTPHLLMNIQDGSILQLP